MAGGTKTPVRLAPPSALVTIYAPPARDLTSPSERPIHLRKRDYAFESHARELLRSLGADKLAREIRVEWNPRLRTCAGRADHREKLISLNPLLRNLDGEMIQTNVAAHQGDRLKRSPLDDVSYQTESAAGKLDCLKQSSLTNAAGDVSEKNGRLDVFRDDIDRTLRHELAHLLAQFRVGRRRIAPHGPEWRAACRDLGIADEARCHNLPFVSKTFPPRYVYRCPNCKEEFPRVRKIRRAIACLACCGKHNGSDFDPRFRLELTTKL